MAASESGATALRETLRRLDGRGYPAYRDLEGSWELGGFTLFVDRVQRDPFAAPSKLRARTSLADAGLPAELYDDPVRRLALRDFLAREARAVLAAPAAAVRGRGARSGSGKSGLLQVDAGGQEVLDRSAVALREDPDGAGGWVELRFEAGLPAAGRRILGRAAATLLCERVPALVERVLRWEHLPRDAARAFVAGVECQETLRGLLAERGLVAFVGNGAVLPRESGASDRPLRGDDVVPFTSPPSLEVELALPDGGRVRGMGIPRGVTLVVGGGYHGKSTLLRALERAVAPHVPGDGRERVVSAPDLVKIRAEDGRRVEGVDIRPFISDLPGGRSTAAFRSDDASGSTSQAANIVEALEAGASGLLLDEDTSATNFMIRDARMQALVAREHEPITPFVDRVRELWERLGISTVLVMGGSGDYFDAADHVIMMRDYRAFDVTEEAREVARRHESGRRRETPAPLAPVAPRVPLAASFDASRGRREVKIDARERDLLLYGSDPIDLRGVEQVFDRSQTRAIGLAIHLATRRFMDGKATLPEVLDALDVLLDAEGLDVLDPFRRPAPTGSARSPRPGEDDRHPGNLARPRRFEIAAAINRLRTVRMRAAPAAPQPSDGSSGS